MLGAKIVPLCNNNYVILIILMVLVSFIIIITIVITLVYIYSIITLKKNAILKSEILIIKFIILSF